MKNFRVTKVLFGVFVALLLIDILAHRVRIEARATLPELPAIEASAPQEIRLSQGDSEIILRRESARAWRINAPFEGRADTLSVERLLQSFQHATAMQVRLGHGEYEVYGLQSPEVLLVEIDDNEGALLLAFYLGRDAPDGSSYMRFPGEQAVYQARLGGRSRFAQPSAFWRNRDLVDLESDAIRSLSLQTASQTLSFSRPLASQPWTSEALDPDQEELNSLTQLFSNLRGQDILPAKFLKAKAQPLVVLTATTDAGQQSLALFADARGSIAQRPEQPQEIYRIKPELVRISTRPKAAWRNRQLFSVDAANIRSMSLHENQLTSVLVRDNLESNWVISKPKNMDVNQQEAMWTVSDLASLRIDALYQGPPVTFKTQSSITFTGAESDHTLEIGTALGQRDLQNLILVRNSDDPSHLGALHIEHLKRIRRAWSR